MSAPLVVQFVDLHADFPSQLANNRTSSSSSEVVGRRGVMGRRAEMDKGEETSPTDKNRRASPADVSPTNADKMSALELISLAQRPGLGRLGRQYRICVNHFEMRIVPKVVTVNHYHVEISHASPTVKLDRDDNRPILWQCLLKNNNELEINRDDMYKIAFDGVANLYTLNPLKLPVENLKRFPIELMIARFDKPTNLTVLIQAVGPVVVDLRQVVTPPSGSKCLTPIQILDVILRQYRSNPLLDSARAFYPFGPSIYMIPGYQGAPGGIDLQGGREIWRGLYTSAHVGEHFRAFVNMDMAHTAFYKQGTNGDGDGNGAGKYTCIMFLCEVLNAADRGGGNYRPDQMNEKTSLNDTMLRVFEREIKVCKDYVQPGTSNQSRHYKVWGVDVGAALIKFKNREEVETSVAEYFRSQYGPLRYPLMPTLKVGKKTRPIHLPIEQTCMPPADRKYAIEQMVQTARFQADPFLKNFGIEVSPRMLDVNSRILNAPPILYANNAPCQVRDGVWRAGNMRFHLPAKAIGVAAIAFQPPGAPPDAKYVQTILFLSPMIVRRNFIAKLLQTCSQAGMQVPNPNSVFFHLETDNSPQRVEKAMAYVAQQMKAHNVELSLAVVFVPVKGSPLYPEIKRIAEVQMGIMTQCITNKTVGKCSPDTLSNIVFKINMKLGGINCELSTRDNATRCLFSEPTLVLGIDVTHPGPTDKRSPSIASVVGSMDLSLMRYAASIKVQKQRREHLVYLSEPVTERLMYFYKATKVKPKRIIVFRDGVSEGEFKT
uniref:Uncharacterized protein n=1 Tax=Romanomermis culicivorax TaxID=13658 RepID=A0A915IE63_ROMCU